MKLFFGTLATLTLVIIITGVILVSRPASTITCSDPFTSDPGCAACTFEEPFGNCPEFSESDGRVQFVLANRLGTQAHILGFDATLGGVPCNDTSVNVAGREVSPSPAYPIEWDELMLAQFRFTCNTTESEVAEALISLSTSHVETYQGWVRLER